MKAVTDVNGKKRKAPEKDSEEEPEDVLSQSPSGSENSHSKSGQGEQSEDRAHSPEEQEDGGQLDQPQGSHEVLQEEPAEVKLFSCSKWNFINLFKK
ncbi:hypothetical protein R1flu_025913 [Riccia fluitans]|uniref:Uncharacterized protein n=1 Tax=Riccia fluitans TaxID=41844 RepID=A0ABD1Y231_9MARC